MYSFDSHTKSIGKFDEKCMLIVFLLLGGLRKLSGICYTDGPEIPKRSRQLVWRAAVEMSENASQLAVQVCCLRFFCNYTLFLAPIPFV